MKPLVLAVLVAFGLGLAFAVTTPQAHAGGLFGLFGSKASPSPSPSPSALPTASPEPPSVAIPRLQAKLKANPNDQQSAAALAAEYLQIGRPDLSLELTQRLLKGGDKSAQVYYYDGYAQQALGNLQAATVDFNTASDLDPTNLGILAQLADMYLKQNDTADAERVAKRAVVFNKKQPAALMELGSVYAAEKKFDKARDEFEAAFKLNPKDSSPIFQIATTYTQQDNIPKALTTIQRALDIDPQNIQALVYRADLYAKQHDDAHATEAYDDAIVAAPTDEEKVQIMVRKAAYFAGEKQNTQALAVFQQMTTLYPKIASGFVAFGDYYATQHQDAAAKKEWHAALAVDPNQAQALLSLGQVAMQEGKTTEGIGYLKQYTQVSPDAQGFALLGEAYSQVRDYRNARDACGKSFQIERTPQTLSCVGGADFELHNYKEAAQIFDVLDRGARGFLDHNPQLLYIAAKSYEGDSQCVKARAAFKRLLPMMRKGTKDYATVAKDANAPCRPAGKHAG